MTTNTHSDIIPLYDNVIVKQESGQSAGSSIVKAVVVATIQGDIEVGDIVYFQRQNWTKLDEELHYVPVNMIIAKRKVLNETESINS